MVLRATVMIKSVALRATDSANSSLIIMPAASFIIRLTVPVGRRVFFEDKEITQKEVRKKE